MKEQNVCMKFCFKWGKDGMKTFEILKEALGE
jgi:hypothetical protein